MNDLVDFYAQMPALGEPEIIHAAVPAGAEILELGSGGGRVTHPLIALGHPVVAVDSEPRMLEHVRGAETVCALIEDLHLGRRFPVVLLGSHLVNRLAPRGLLVACARHVAPDGVVLIERHSPAWFANPRGVRDVTRPGPGLLQATVDHQIGDQRWTEEFLARDHDLPRLLAASGLVLDRFLTEDERWVVARP